MPYLETANLQTNMQLLPVKDCIMESCSMMSEDDRDLLVKLRPDLMKSLEIEGSDMLAQLRSRDTVTYLEEEEIRVIKQKLSCFTVTAVVIA